MLVVMAARIEVATIVILGLVIITVGTEDNYEKSIHNSVDVY